jgi:predicted dehydrogenase
MDGVMWVHHRRTEKIHEALRAGAVGELKRVTAAFSFRFEEIPKDNIRLAPELGGGCLGDLGYYCVRAILTWFGEAPQRVWATARCFNGVDFNLSGHCWYSNDRTASFDCGFDTVMRQWFEIAGTKASIVCDDFVLPTSDHKARFWIHDAEGKSREVAVHDCVQQVEMVRRFAEMVRNKEGLDAALGDAIATMRVCDALSRSAKEGKPISV